jgi:D-serine/D-alanine/glycine transporter
LAFVIVILALAADTRVALFVTPVWFILLIGIYKLRNMKANQADEMNQEKVSGN